MLATVSPEGVQLWDLAARREGDKLLETLPVRSSMAIHFDPKGESLITAGSVGLDRWPITPDVETGRLQVGPPRSLDRSARRPLPLVGYDPDIAVSADGRTITHSPYLGRVLLFEAANPARNTPIQSPILRYTAFSADGRWLATGTWQGSDQVVKVWDARTEAWVRDLDVGQSQRQMVWPSFSPDGNWLVTGTSAEYRFWEVGSREVGSWQ